MAEARRLLRLAGVAAAVLASVGVAASVTMANADQSADKQGSGTVTPKIIGGSETTIEENPYMVALTTPDGFQFCGGAIVAPHKILTAAHCTVDSQPADIVVVSGRTSLSQDQGETANVTNIWVNPNFDQNTMVNDSSVLTLDKDLTAAPIQIATPDDAALYTAGANSTVLGWGTDESGNTSDVLKKVDVPVTADADCTASYQDQFDPNTMVCAGLKEGGKDSCQGDSGGPLVGLAADGTLKEIGIVSWGQGCAEPNFYGVYGRVAAMSDLIQEQINS
ncbi:MAG TPA: serine protease [Actinophytocola sp.]|jgi:secreted trypsin-like serine protease|uniref:S1 family peptidase n=1 Tax=Actinophytocola sp. TaxID=1872138 RepID=UPI002F939E9B